jgi:hypothetical protein
MRIIHPLYQSAPPKFLDPCIKKTCPRFPQTFLTTEYMIPRARSPLFE